MPCPLEHGTDPPKIGLVGSNPSQGTMKWLLLLALTGCQTITFPEGWCRSGVFDEEMARRHYYKTRAICQQTPAYFSECMKDHDFQHCK